MFNLLNIERTDHIRLSSLFVVNAVLIVLILVLRQFQFISVPQYLLVAYVLLYALIAPYDKLVYYIAFLFPLSNGMNTIVFVPLLLLLFIKSPKISISQWIFSTIFMCMELLLLKESGYTIPYNRYLVFVGMFGIFMFLVFDKVKTIDYGIALKMFCIGTSVLLVCILIKFILDDPISQIQIRMSEANADLNETEMILNQVFSLNANAIGYFSSVAYACMLIGRKKIHLSKISYTLMLIAILVPGAFSISRTWMILTALATAVYFIINISVKRIISIAVITLLAFSFVSVYAPSVIEMFETRFEGDDIEGGNGRTEIFEDYNNYLANHTDVLVFGSSTINYYQVIKPRINMHNGIQQIYVFYGIWGMTLFIFMGFIFYCQFIRKQKIKPVYYLPFGTAFLFVQTIQFLHPHYCMLPIAIACMAIKLGERKVV